MMIDFERLAETLGSDNVIIGVSGGVDSMVLLDQITSKREIFTCNFKVLHVNHCINPESRVWARFVENYCKEIGMPCEIVEVDISKWGNNLEQAARKSRYNEFSKQDCDSIILAHHGNDQVETFFLKLFRGSGPKGLRCMKYCSPCWFDERKQVVRPLLDITKTQLVDYAITHNVQYITDPSNADTSYDRNWVRQCLVPFIQARHEIADINIRKAIAIQDEAYGLMTDLAQIDLEKIKLDNSDLDWKKLKLLSLPRLKNLIMFICAENNLIDVSIHHVETFARGLLSADGDSKNELRLRDFHMYKRGTRVIIK